MSAGTTTTSSAESSIDQAQKFFEELLNRSNDMLLEGVAKSYQNMADATWPIITAIILAWITWRGIQIMLRPNAEQSLNEFFIKALKIMTIAIFAFSWSYVYRYVADIAMNGVPEFIAKATGSNSNTLVMSFVDNLVTSIKSSIDSFDSENPVSGVFAVMMITVITFVVAVAVIVSYFYILIKAKLIVAILLVLTPIFLSCLMFDSTRSYFFNWINALVAPLLTLLLLNLIVGLLGNLIYKIFQEFFVGGELGQSLSGAFMGCIVGFFMFKLIQEAPQIASNLVSSGFGLSMGSGAFNPVQKYREFKAGRDAQKIQQAQQKNKQLQHQQLVDAIKTNQTQGTK